MDELLTSERPRDVILVHRYYFPDTPPYASILHRVATHLADAGHRVQVLTSQPSYLDVGGPGHQPSREEIDGCLIRRLPLLDEPRSSTFRRVANLLLFSTFVFAIVAAQARRDTVVTAATTPPILVAAAVAAAATLRGAQFVYHAQDIYPDVLGEPSRWWSRTAARVARRADIATGKRAASIVVLSEDMAQTWEDRGVTRDRLTILNNFDPWAGQEVSENSQQAEDSDGSDSFVIVFAGNLGKFQQLDLLVKAVAQTGDDVSLTFVGDGVHRKQLEQLSTTTSAGRVQFVGRTTPAEARQLVEQANLAVVSLRPRLFRFVYPSKFFSYVAAGTPILALIEPESELARTVISEGLGVVAARMTPEDIAKAIDHARGCDPAMFRSNLSRYHQDVCADQRLSDWLQLITTVGRPHGVAASCQAR